MALMRKKNVEKINIFVALLWKKNPNIWLNRYSKFDHDIHFVSSNCDVWNFETIAGRKILYAISHQRQSVGTCEKICDSMKK